MKNQIKVSVLSLAGVVFCASAAPTAFAAVIVPLGTVANFAVLAGSVVTNTGASVVEGNVGTSPGTSITGFPPGVVLGGTFHTGDAVAAQAQADATTAYNFLAALAPTQDLSGQDLGARTLGPGIYFLSSSAQITGTLILDAQGAIDPQFIFQIGSTLNTASNSAIIMAGGADPSQVYFQVGSSTTLGTNSSFVGTSISLVSSTLTTGAEVTGSVIARNGSVTLDTNHVTSIPEPASVALLASSIGAFCIRRVRRKLVI